MDRHKENRFEVREEDIGVPGLELLSNADKKWINDLKGITDLTEEEFIARNPDLLRKVTGLRKELADFRGSGSSEKVYEVETELKKYADKKRYWATTMDLVRIYLSELYDANQKVSGVTPTFYSHRTRNLVTNLLEQMRNVKLTALLPDLNLAQGLHKQIESGDFPEDTGERVALFHRILNTYHQRRGETTPYILKYGIKDAWRYPVSKIKLFLSGDQKEEYFLDRLSNLKLAGEGEFLKRKEAFPHLPLGEKGDRVKPTLKQRARKNWNRQFPMFFNDLD